MAEEPKGKKSQLLFENCRFAVYLHEELGDAAAAGDGATDGPVTLQVRMREKAGRAALGLGGGLGDSMAATEAAGTYASAATGVAEGENSRAWTVKRRSSDILVEFRPTQPPAAAQAVRESPGRDSSEPVRAAEAAGCWYGCEEAEEAAAMQEAEEAEEEEEEEEEEDTDVAPEAPSVQEEAAEARLEDQGLSVGPLASWAWADSDLDDEPRDREPSQALAQASLLRQASPASDGPSAFTEASTTASDRRRRLTGSFDDLAEDQEVKPRGWRDQDDEEGEDCEGDDARDPEEGAEGFWYSHCRSQAPLLKSLQLSAPRSGEELVHLSRSKVEWRIYGVEAQIKRNPKGCRIFSPEFCAFGVSGLGLVFYPNGNSNAKQGFCSLGLKAPHGTHLRYKLSVGATERFTDLRHNVTESWGFVDMCKVRDEVEDGQDLLRLGTEIVDDINDTDTLKTVSPGKITWTIGNISNKLDHYGKDVALYSDEFSAGGVDRLRFKFYPAGKKEADPGWCSLYLEAPKGSELRCRLSVGKKSMSFDRLEKFGEDSIWGFLTLCRICDELDQDGDCVRIGLEVLETKRLDSRLSDAEDAYLKTLGADKRQFLLGELDRVERLRSQGDGSVPSRFRILSLELPDAAKAVALAKLDAMQADLLSGESSKLKKWLDGLLSIPFGVLRRPLVSLDKGRARVQEYLRTARACMDSAVYGHEEPKQKIVQLLCQWIANPLSNSLVLGIQGPPGNGKTTLCRRGIAEALKRPFVQISLGGATDASVLEGHSYTYVGSSWGRIAGLVMEAGCMNPVIFFDELDKVSETPRGEEIIGVLTHLTDHSQNKTFADRYFEGIPLDLSRALFVFSFNDESKLNPVLKDRLTVINTEGFDQAAKLKIAREHLLPELLANVGLQSGEVDLGQAELAYLCQRCGVPLEDGGVRGIKQALESVVLHLNELRLTQEPREEMEGKADSGQRGEGGEAEEAPECKADGGERPPAQDAPAGRRRASSRKRRVDVRLPVRLTTELIEQLVTQSRAKSGGPPMMYS